MRILQKDFFFDVVNEDYQQLFLKDSVEMQHTVVAQSFFFYCQFFLAMLEIVCVDICLEVIIVAGSFRQSCEYEISLILLLSGGSSHMAQSLRESCVCILSSPVASPHPHYSQFISSFNKFMSVRFETTFLVIPNAVRCCHVRRLQSLVQLLSNGERRVPGTLYVSKGILQKYNLKIYRSV